MAVDLTTTNVLLGILAAVSVIEALAFVGEFVGGYLLFRRVTTLIEGIEEHQVAPTAARVNEIPDDVKIVTGVAKSAAERDERAAGWWHVFRGA